MKRYLIGVDNGGTYIKAAIFDVKGRQLFIEKVLSPAENDGSGRSERNQTELWMNNCRCIRSLLNKSGIDPAEIAGIGFAGQGKGLYCVDKDGNDIRNAITSADIRAKQTAEQLMATEAVHGISAKVCQDIHSYQPLALLRWMKDNEPADYAAIQRIFSMKDYLNYRMTGVAASDYSSQSGSPFIDFDTGEYDREILDAVGVADKWEALPPLHNPGDICGYVTRAAHELTGLATGTPVSIGMFDVNASALAMGVLSDDIFFIITGTWSINAYASKAPVTDGSVMFNSIYFMPGYYQIEEGSPTSAGILEWAVPLLYRDECDRSDIYDRINSDVASVDPISSDVVFLPFIHGCVNSDRICGAWIGMNAASRREELIAALFEGVAFGHRYHIERLKKNCTAEMRYRLAGGVVNSSVWVQIFADVFNHPIELVQDKELGAQGVAISAGLAAGIYNDYATAAEQCIGDFGIAYPNPERARIYETKYQHFIRLLSAVS